MLGKIPICDTCGGGKLRFDTQTGEYECPGYVEDVEFIRYEKKFAFNQIVRLPWTN